MATPLGLFIQPACLQHKYIRHPNASHIFERPERLRAVLLGVAAAVARLEQVSPQAGQEVLTANDDLSKLLSSLSITQSPSQPTPHLHLVSAPPLPFKPGNILLHHPAVQVAHSPVGEAPFPYIGEGSAGGAGVGWPQSDYLKDLVKWCEGAVERIKETGCEIPEGLGLNPGDLYLGPGTIEAVEGAIQTVCQAIDTVFMSSKQAPRQGPTTPPVSPPSSEALDLQKAFCVIRPPGHHCGEDAPSGFCYINNVVTGAMHAYLQHDVDRAIIIDFDLHHGNGTQALVMPLNAAAEVEDIQVRAGKPPMMRGKDGRARRGWKGFYGSVHDIYSYPCEDGDLDLIRDASISLAAHGQHIENIHLKPYASEADFYERIYPLYLALLDKARVFMEEEEARPGSTVIFISAGFDACEWEHEGMQRHHRRVPVSFYSRYTRDIAAFANKYTNCRVVSVLEGGYSDRALTSAAMGHILGMRSAGEGQDGKLPEDCDAWWTEKELINLEKAGKKKRGATSKLAPLPSDLAQHSHLVRTRSLLSTFEGQSIEVTPAPSTEGTPQGRTRMALRERRPVASTEGTPVAAKRGARGKVQTTPGSNLRGDATVEPSPAKPLTESTNTSPSDAAKVAPGTEVVPSQRDSALPAAERPLEKSEDGLDGAVEGLANVSLGATADTNPAPLVARNHTSQPETQSQSAPKIMLRIPARSSSSSPSPSHKGLDSSDQEVPFVKTEAERLEMKQPVAETASSTQGPTMLRFKMPQVFPPAAE
ncbi:hypothetical protein B9479_006160 [Cryptococcus floricola]|uniref:Histone deacetylase domain-containing protein n=1 Tax=Cryptococcus floricola TaxID=2591691 RepID=A0A5D3ANY5_9TREE|nr:hypothetical protein B9479_006160 [Cryptococcus floricola]